MQSSAISTPVRIMRRVRDTVRVRVKVKVKVKVRVRVKVKVKG